METEPSFNAEVTELTSADMILGRGRFSCRLKQRGAPPLGYRTFVVPNRTELRMIWRGHHVTGSDLLVFPLKAELDATSDGRFDVYTLSFPEEMILSLSEKLGATGLEKRLQRAEVFRCDPERMERLRFSLSQWARYPEPSFFEFELLKNRICTRLIDALVHMNANDSKQTQSLRKLNALREVDRFIYSNPEEIPSVKYLCKLIGVSERTLQYTFLEQYGMGPKAYINVMRLNGVRRELQTRKKVSDAANAWGFWHMGQFARDYRILFGELPSQTLATSS